MNSFIFFIVYGSSLITVLILVSYWMENTFVAVDYQFCTSCLDRFDVETMSADDDQNWFCTDCWAELEPVIRQEYQELIKKGEVDEEY